MGEMRVDGKPGTLVVPRHLDGVCAAGNGRRALANVIDFGISFGAGILYILILMGAWIGLLSSVSSGSDAGAGVSIVALFLPAILEGILGIVNLVMLLTRGQTVARHFAKTRIVRFDTGKQAGIRSCGKILLENLVAAGPLVIGLMIDNGRSVDYYYYSEPATPIFTILFGIAGVAAYFWIVFKTQDEANRHWFDRVCGVLTIDLRQGRDSNSQEDSSTGVASAAQPGLGVPSLAGLDLENKESLPPLPSESSSSAFVPPLPPLPASDNSSMPPLPPKPPTSLDSVPPLPPLPLPSGTPPFASVAVPPSPVQSFASDDVAPLPPLPPTPTLPSEMPPLPPESVVSGTLPSPDGFIDEVPWRKSGSTESQLPALPEPSIVPPVGLDEESDVDETVVSPKNKPVTLVFDDGTSFVLEQDVVVGRDPQCDISHQGAIRLQVDDPSLSVSKTHMALALKAGALLVEDLYSTNGTQVTTPEGQTSDVLAGSPVIVARGTLIQFGDRSVRVGE